MFRTLKERAIIRASKKAMTVLNETLTRQGVEFVVYALPMHGHLGDFLFPVTCIRLPAGQLDWFICVEVKGDKAFMMLLEDDERNYVLYLRASRPAFELQLFRRKLPKEFAEIAHSARLAWLDFPGDDPSN